MSLKKWAFFGGLVALVWCAETQAMENRALFEPFVVSASEQLLSAQHQSMELIAAKKKKKKSSEKEEDYKGGGPRY